MANLELAKKILIKAVTSVSEMANHEATAKSISSLSSTVNSSVDFTDLDISFDTDDPDVNEVIKKLQLQKPENMIRFLIELHSAEVEGIMSGISDIKRANVKDSIALVKAARTEYDLAIENPQHKEDFLMEASDKLNLGMSQLYDKANDYIKDTRKIDNKNWIQMLLYSFSRANRNGIKENNRLSKAAVKALIEAYNIYMAISAELGLKIENSVKASFKKIKEELVSGDNCALMNAYDPESEDQFWLNLPDIFAEAAETAGNLKEYLSSTEDSDLDFENIQYN